MPAVFLNEGPACLTMANLNMWCKFILLCSLPIVIQSCKEEQEQQPEPYSQTGEASYYAEFFEGRKTASGEIFRQDSLTAAHNTLPFGTIVKVVNLSNSKEVVVEINDRGPYAKGRIIDISRTAAKKLDMLQKGTAWVKLEVVHPAPGYILSDSISRQ